MTFTLLIAAALTAPLPPFDDAALDALLESTPRAAVCVWSPHMPLSAESVKSVLTAGKSLGVPVIAVLDPRADLGYATATAAAMKLPAGATRVLASRRLIERGALNHSPTLITFRPDREPAVRPGHLLLEEYEHLLRQSLAPSPDLVRPRAGEPPIDDVNWFSRPVPHPRGHKVVAFASRNLNYLYDLTTGRRVRIPDRSDAVATPDGRYMTVPSHYTDTHTINFYDLDQLIQRLDAGKDASDVPPVFAHSAADVFDVFYQSVGIVSHASANGIDRTIYRMMFSGSTKPAPPGFRIVDYEFTRAAGKTEVKASTPMRLCPEIVRDFATPFISKDGRYVIAHDDSQPTRPPSLKIFEILHTDPERQTSTCRKVLDFGFPAGKADFSYDGTRVTFHLATYDYLAAFIDNGLRAPVMTDVVVADLVRTNGEITGFTNLTRVTRSSAPGTGSYFPAFFPDGSLFYLSNLVPKNASEPKRFTFTVTLLPKPHATVH